MNRKHDKYNENSHPQSWNQTAEMEWRAFWRHFESAVEASVPFLAVWGLIFSLTIGSAIVKSMNHQDHPAQVIEKHVVEVDQKS